MKATILIILAVLSTTANSSEVYLTLGGWSIHDKKYISNPEEEYDKYKSYADSGREYILEENLRPKINNKHNAFIVDYSGFTVGTYYNSYYKQTYLAGYTYRINNFSFVAAYSRGYEKTPSCISLLNGCAIFSASYSMPYNTKISYMGDSLSLSFEFNFKGKALRFAKLW